jgi:hypothetical protein
MKQRSFNSALGGTMTKIQEDLKLPPKWAEDSLSDFIQASFQNALATFVHKKHAFNLLLDVDGVFKGISGNLDYTKTPLEPALLHRSHSAFLASCRLAMSGQATETFPQLRSCLEYALYALHINENPPLAEIWLRRHESNSSLKEVKRNFRHVDVMKTLVTRDAALHDILFELYERTIDFGGHPNERAVLSSTSMRDEGESTVIRNQYLHSGDSSALDHALHTSAQIGLGSLIVFQLIYKERFGILDLQDKVESLYKVLFGVT